MSSSRFLKSSSKITSRKLPSLYQRDLPLIVSRDGLVQHIHRESKINPHCSALISLDVSNTVIGVAITDATRTFVEPLTRFKLHSVNKLPHPPIFIVNKLEELFKSNGICAVILGWPLVSLHLITIACSSQYLSLLMEFMIIDMLLKKSLVFHEILNIRTNK